MKQTLLVLVAALLVGPIAPAAGAADTLVPLGSVWKYLDDGSDQGTAWIAPPFDDSSWASGLAELGYGDGDEATVVGFGPDSDNKYITTYFRHEFNVPDPLAYVLAQMRVRRDDGVVIYLNGVEIYRNTMPLGPVDHLTLALTSVGDENAYLPANVDAGLLVAGRNVLAAEIHQATLNSSDISFDFELTASTENAPPTVALVSPAPNAFFTAPAAITLTATASDSDGAVALIEYFEGETRLGEDAAAPYTFVWLNVPDGNFALRAVATDNLGARATSAVVNVTVGVASAPTVGSKMPAPGNVASLNSITVTFSENVSGVDAANLLINGTPATSVTHSGTSYTFAFPQPSEGAVFIGWRGMHGIADFENPPRPFDPFGAGATWQYTLTDTVAPVITRLNPAAGATLREFDAIEVTFSEPVSGVDAADLRVNNVPATSVSGRDAGPYQFQFDTPANGTLNVTWAAAHGVTDRSAARNAFVAGPWSCTLNSSAVAEGQIVIHEIMYHPATEQTDDEWIELRNLGSNTVNLTGWRLNRGVDFDFPSVTLAAGGHLVVAANLARFNANYPGVANVLGGWTGQLSNTRDSIELQDASGNQVDLVTYADQGDWAVRTLTAGVGLDWFSAADGFGPSMELCQPALDNNRGQNWRPSTAGGGTPGAANSVASTDTRPMILDVQHLPSVPRSTNAITLLARIVDESPSGLTVRLWWRDGATSDPFASVPMLDNGASDDGAANDGIFGVVLPPMANGTITEFYIEAMDAASNTRVWPALVDTGGPTGGGPLAQEANALFQVDNGDYTGQQPIYRIVMRPNDRNDLFSLRDRVQRNATFITLEGGDLQVRYLCEARRRGASSFSSTPPTMKFNIPADRPWNDKTSMNLNSVNTYAQVLGAAVAAKAGLPAPATRAVQMRFNGVNESSSGTGMFGSYAHVEVVNSEWARDHFPDDGNGNAYFKRRPECGFSYRGPTAEGYVNCAFSKESNASENDWTDLINLFFALDPTTTPDNDYVQAVRRNANVEEWLRYWAVLYLMNFTETSIANGADDDYNLYRGIVDPRFLLLPHDFDQIFGSEPNQPTLPDNIFVAGNIATVSRFLHHPEFEPLYYAEFRRQLAGLFTTNNLFPLFDQLLGDWVPTATIQARKDNALNRMNYVLSVLPPAPVVVRAIVSGEPDSPAYQNAATLNVGGADITHYRYRVNGGAWSADTPVSQPIDFTGLADGHYTVSVVGRNSAGAWQTDADATLSKTWAVLSSLRGVVINEVLARNDDAVNHEGTFPDIIELFNSSASSVDLSGLRLTGDLDDPNQFTFPAGTTLAAGDHRVVFANDPDGTSGLHTGFGLDQNGDVVYLLDRATNGHRVLDSVTFGWQLPDLSSGRLSNGQWGLCTLTAGGANVAAPVGSPATLKINEWLAFPAAPFVDDFIELHNPDPLPVNLDGLHLTDLPYGAPQRHRIAPLCFIEGFGYRAFIADGRKSAGSDHVDFSLASEVGEIALFGRDGTLIDCVAYQQQFAGVSQGRSPNGGSRIVYFDLPTPGAGNPAAPLPSQPQLVNLMPYHHVWRYEQTGTDLGPAWRVTDYDDSAWPSGPGLLAAVRNGGTLPEPVGTTLTVSNTKPTFYFRTHFQVANLAQLSELQLTHIFDDGAVVYLNGVEIYRYNLPSGPIDFVTLASGNILDSTYQGPIPLPLTELRAGTNHLAVEMHQASLASQDIVLGLRLDGVILTNNPALAGIKINEVLANARQSTNSDGTVTSWVELYNPSNDPTDLSGISFTDQLTTPRRWVFPQGAVIAAMGYRAVRFDSGTPATTNLAAVLNTGFGIKASGGWLYLFNRPQSGGELLDAVSFGIQAPDWSIGRVPNGGSNWVLNVPSPDSANIAAALGNPALLKINEWMADPSSGGDWFEIYNPNAQPVELSGLYLSDDLNDRLKYPPIAPRSYVAADLLGFVKIIADDNAGAGADHVPFALSKNGDSIGLSERYGSLIDQVTFGPQSKDISQGRLLDGTTNIVSFPSSSTPEESNYLPIPNVVIHEVLSHTDPPLEDAIELRNTSASPVNIGGWFLSDSRTALKKYRIPTDTMIPANSFKVFYEIDFNSNNPATPFSLNSAHGDEVHLSAADTGGQLTGYRAVVSFGPAANGVSFGRYVTSPLNGNKVEFPAMAQRTFGADNPSTLDDFRSGAGRTNSGLLVGPVVISEIMYHPPDLPGGVDDVAGEFIELRNITGSPVPLYDPAFPTNVWRLKDAVSFRFPTNTIIAANGYIVVVSFHPTNTTLLNAFRTKYNVQAGAVILGPYNGKLSNNDASVELARPDWPQPPTEPDAGLVSYILVDKVKYDDSAPWSAAPDGSGSSLTRITLSNYGNDPVNWVAATPTPGPQGANPDGDGDGMNDAWEIQYFGDLNRNGSGDFDGDGLTDLEEFLAGTNPTQASRTLHLTARRNGAMVDLQFTAVAGRTYSVRHSPVLSGGGWTTFANVPAQGNTQPVIVQDGIGGPQRFYRVVTPAVP